MVIIKNYTFRSFPGIWGVGNEVIFFTLPLLTSLLYEEGNQWHRLLDKDE